MDVVWLMPVYPIGEKGRKGTLGSYYAIKDYCDINPEFGTLEDFDDFVGAAHDLGLKVIIDWVANHTSPDHPWVTGKPADWYVRDAEGNTIVEYDWTDIAKLNYESKEMRAEMEKSMRFWLDRGSTASAATWPIRCRRISGLMCSRSSGLNIPADSTSSPRGGALAARGRLRRHLRLETAPSAERHRAGKRRSRQPCPLCGMECHRLSIWQP